MHDALIRQPERSRPLHDTGFTLQVLRAGLTSALLVLTADPLASFFNEPRLFPVVLVLLVGSLASGFENIGTADFRRDLRFDLEFRMQATSRIASVLVTVGGAIMLRTYWALIAGLVVSRLIRLGMSYWLSPYRPGWSLREWRPFLGYSVWTWASIVVGQIRERIVIMSIGRTLGPTSVGIYTVGSETGGLSSTELLEPLHRALFSGFASQHRSDEDYTGMFLTAIGVALLVVMPAGFGVSIVADPLVRLALGETWVTAVPVIQIIGIGSTVTVFYYVSNALQLALGQPRLALAMMVAATAFRVPAILVGLWLGGLTGVAWGLMASYAFEQVMAMLILLPRLRIRFAQFARVSWRPVLGCAAMAATLHAWGFAWTPTTATGPGDLALALLGRASAGAAVYGGVVMVLWVCAGRPQGGETTLWTAARAARGR